MRYRFLFLLVFLAMSHAVSALEPWADEKLPVKNGVVLWLDAGRLKPARTALNLPALNEGRVDVWHDGSGQRRHVIQAEVGRMPVFRETSGGGLVEFDGASQFLGGQGPDQIKAATVFVVAAPHSNAGGFRALASFSSPAINDYRSGLNLDQGQNGREKLDVLNVEGSGVTGPSMDLMKSAYEFGTFHVSAVVAGAKEIQVRVDGKPEEARPRADRPLSFARMFIGARHYSNESPTPRPQGFLDGHVAEVLVYDRELGGEELQQVERYLMAKHSRLEPVKLSHGSKPLRRVDNPAPVQFHAPGFTFKEAPIQVPESLQKDGKGLPNINFLRYRHDGMLVAGGYNGRIWLLRDTDGDGLEDSASLYHESKNIRVIMGMAVTPKGDPRGDGVFVATLGHVFFIPDRNGDGRGDEEVDVASGWQPPQVFAGGASDCLGLALDRDGSVWFGLGTKNMFKPYVPDLAGKMTYDVADERGSIYRVSPDFKTRERICSGIRYPVGFAFNAAGDLFVTDQEGATWLSNGNPYDELLHIQRGRHYGFPPRHPQFLPQVNDEPSVFDFEPQHVSTCGFFFNERQEGGALFGRDWMHGDAFVCGESRGKVWRLKLVKTEAGYVAQSHLMATLPMLPIDAVLSPRGDIVVTCHSGAPDWGSGPNGIGKIFHLKAGEAPLPVTSWAAAPGEWRIAFDRPLRPEDLRDLTRRTDVTAGRHVYAGDRYETVRPGYQVVHDQLLEPRKDVSVLSTSLSADRRTLIVHTPPRLQSENVAITIPTSATDPTPVDVQTSLHGVLADWQGADGKKWSGWLPHPDLAVSGPLVQASAEHGALWPLLKSAGRLTLRGQLDLWHMLRPDVQPGSKLDHEYALEDVSVVFTAGSPFQLKSGGRTQTSAPKDGRHSITVTSTPQRSGEWLAFEFVTEAAAPLLNVHWFTREDMRARAFPLRRVLLPWALPAGTGVAQMAGGATKREIPELRGGDWERGKAVFNGKAACATCHTLGTAGAVPKLGPDLANLIHRDYASVARDLMEPSAALNPEHIGQNVETTDGESFTAVLSSEKDGVLTFVEASGVRKVPRARIKSLTPASLSLMPQGLWEALAPEERRDLMTFLLTTPAADLPGRDPHVIKAVILTGRDGPFHQWEKTSIALKQELERDSRFHVQIVTDPEWLAGDEVFKADVLIQHYVNYNVDGLGERAKANLLKYVNEGGGLAVLHFANGAFNPLTTGPASSDWPDYRRLFLQRAWVGKQGSTHDNYGAFRVMPAQSGHPIVAGLAAFDTIDELYFLQIPSSENAEVEPLITATSKMTKRDEPLAWAFERGQGRVFQSLLGHSHVSMHAAGEFHRRGIAWASGRHAVAAPLAPAPLTLEGAPPPRKMGEVKAILGNALAVRSDLNARPLRIVLCASAKDAAHGRPGAHDYPLWRSRWSRLLGMADGIRVETADRWPAEEQWKMADIIVFNSYNPAWADERDASALQRRGTDMDRFLARGGGIVFIHYALNAGGNASLLASRLGAAWRIPPARFRHGAKDWVLDRNHPLAAGFTKFEIPDESYWHLTGDLQTAGASILATSLEENSPTPQMWTRETGGGRVFVSVPGHFTWTYDDPLYRILILRGMMWTAGEPLDRLAHLSIIGARVEE